MNELVGVKMRQDFVLKKKDEQGRLFEVVVGGDRKPTVATQIDPNGQVRSQIVMNPFNEEDTL